MADADLYRIEELPGDELGGGSGEKRKFRLEFIGKAPNERWPYTVANEVVSSHLGRILGFNIPIAIPHRVGGEQLAMVLWMRPASRRQQGAPPTSKELKQFVDEHSEEIHGAIVLDLFSANSDRSFGPERRNVGVDERGELLLFDFGSSLFYRTRAHAGIQSGIERLDAVEASLSAMFDKAEKSDNTLYLQLLTDPNLVRKWCERIRELPDFVLDVAVDRLPQEIDPPSFEERQRLKDFLKKRKNYLLDHIRSNPDLFPNLLTENLS